MMTVAPGLSHLRLALRGAGSCDQHVAEIAGVDLPVGAEVNLETRNARDGALRGADLGGIVGEGRNAVAQQRRRVREECTCELHSVARVSREPDHDVVQLLYIGFIHCLNLKLIV